MKDTSSELYLDSIEIYAPTLDSDIDGTSNSPNPAHQHSPSRPNSQFNTGHGSDQ